MAGYTYEKLDENLDVITCPMNDLDGSITGHIVVGLRQWFDENPEERKRLGWIKHLTPTLKEQLGEDVDLTGKYLTTTLRQIDEYTVEDEYHIMPMSEEMMEFAEMANALGLEISLGVLLQDRNGGIMYHV